MPSHRATPDEQNNIRVLVRELHAAIKQNTTTRNDDETMTAIAYVYVQCGRLALTSKEQLVNAVSDIWDDLDTLEAEEKRDAN